jgi:membrane protease YdiL (CAAX protease family)
MKKLYRCFEIAIIFLLLVLPTFFVDYQPSTSFTPRFSLLNFVQLIIILLLCYQYLTTAYGDTYIPLKQKKEKRNISIKKCFLYAFIAFILLCAINLFLNLIAYIYPNFCEEQITKTDFKFSAVSFFLLALQFIISAFYEESVYRLFLPESLIKLFPRFYTFIEFFVVLAFSLGHRYLGILAVINAFLSGIVLRLLFIKTKTIIPGAAVHIIYNSLSFMLLFFTSKGL